MINVNAMNIDFLENQGQPLLLPTSSTHNNGTNTTLNINECATSRNIDDTPKVLSLSQPLRILFGLNGIILALPTTALLYMVNTHVQIPLSLIPSYMSISFLPCSLKPLYAYISSSIFMKSMRFHRHLQIITLLILSGIFCIITAYIPSHAVLFCFVLAFFRCITTAWPDFLFDLILIDEAIVVSSKTEPTIPTVHSAPTSSYAETAAYFQSQAATDRSTGCIVAHLLALTCLGFYYFAPIPWLHQHNNDLIATATKSISPDTVNETSFKFLLIATGFFNFISAMIAWKCSIGQTTNEIFSGRSTDSPLLFSSTVTHDCSSTNNVHSVPLRTPSYDSFEANLCSDDLVENFSLEIDTSREPLLQTDDTQHTSTAEYLGNVASAETTTNPRNSSNQSSNNIWLVVLLQTLVILFSIRNAIIYTTSLLSWTGMVTLSMLAFLVIAYHSSESIWKASPASSTRQIRVGLFLMLRYAIPSIAYLMSSYVYTAFKDFPFAVQLLSLCDMCTTTLACWTYRKFLSRYSYGNQLLWLIATTTALAGIVSFGNVIIIRTLGPQNKNHYSMAAKVMYTICINAAVGFFNEWKFLPDLVLATVSVETNNPPIRNASTGDSNIETRPSIDSDVVFQQAEQSFHDCSFSHNGVGMQYGSFVSCIDFGGQIGALLAGPLIAIFGTSRDNDWKHLEFLQEINSLMMLLSIALLFIIFR